MSKHVECLFFKRGGENFAPYSLICSVKIHLCLVDIHMLIQICETIIEPDIKPIPFGRELSLHGFISKRMSFWVILLINNLCSFGMLFECLMGMSSNDCYFFLLWVGSFERDCSLRSDPTTRHFNSLFYSLRKSGQHRTLIQETLSFLS